MASYGKLKERFIAGCRMRQNVDYGNKASVQKYNSGMDACRKAVKQIDEEYPSMIEDFSGLLASHEPEVRFMCAFCLLDIAHLSPEQELRALDKVREYFDTQFSPMTMEEWVERWNERKKAKE